jgi:integrase
MGKRRGNGEGSISKRKDGRWVITLTTGIKDNGKPKKIYKYSSTQSEAVKLLNKLRSEYSMGVDLTKGEIKVSDWSKTWLDTYKKRLASSTRTSYQTNLRVHINEFIGGIAINKLTTAQIQYMLDSIYNNGENSLSLVIKVYNVLNGSLNKAVELGMIAKNPCNAVEFPKNNKKKIRVFSIEEQKAFVKELDNWDSKALFITYLFTGARLGEIPSLKWTDIDLQRRTLDINKKAIVISNNGVEGKKTMQIVEDFCKTETSTRKVVITPFLVDILQDHKEKQKHIAEALNIEWSEESLVFPTSKGTIPYARNIQEKFGRITKKIGITDATMHSLRHSYATRLFEAGVDIKVVSEQLGHKTVKITYDTYVHVMPDKKIKEIDKLNDIDKLIV